MKPFIQCHSCGRYIFDGETYLFDEMFDAVFCSDDCNKENFTDNIDKMHDKHMEYYVYEQDEID